MGWLLAIRRRLAARKIIRRFSGECSIAMALANQEALRRNHAEITPSHILLGTLARDDSNVERLLRHLELDRQSLSTMTQKALDGAPPAGPEASDAPKKTPSAAAKRVVEKCIELAGLSARQDITAGHLLGGVLSAPDAVVLESLQAQNRDPKEIASKTTGFFKEGP